MKKTILMAMVGCICLLSAGVALSAQAQRAYQNSGHFYIIDFDYNTEWATVPVTNPPGQPHYSAKITVSEIVDGEKKELATFGGQYTEKGCFEDDPASLVTQALKIITPN